MGLARDTVRAIRLNLRALPTDSRYSSTRPVRSWSAQYCSRSLADTSARLPMAAKLDAPWPGLPDAVEQRAADGPRLRQQRHRARAGVGGGEGGVQAHLGVGVDHAEAVRAEQPHAV